MLFPAQTSADVFLYCICYQMFSHNPHKLLIYTVIYHTFSNILHQLRT